MDLSKWILFHKKIKEKKVFALDSLIPDLFVFPPSASLHQHPLRLNGSFMFQDKASCFPVHALNPKPKSNWHVLDACAAPGNKTIHLSALMKNKGTIFACDIDAHRLELLKKTAEKAGATNVKAIHSDFLKMNPRDPRFSKVKGVLLDPSCSGSGTVFYKDTSKPLEELANFQLSVILHAFKFPNTRRIVYSTCSINQQENEDVVMKALKGQSKSGRQWTLKKIIPDWPRRGLPVFEDSESCLRTSPREDNTLGFFVACFKR